MNCHRITRSALALALVFATGGNSTASADDPPQWTRLDVYPPEVTLSGEEDYQQVIVVATRSDRVTQDVTEHASLEVSGEAATTALEGPIVHPVAEGEARVVATFSGLTAESKVHVANADQSRPASFAHDVVPILMRAGCNSGSCHGASRGKDGFRLSLFGFDPAGDHYRITRELAGRRINLAIPEDSLLLEKAVGEVAHTGGKRFEDDSWYYQAIRDWLADGAASDVAEAPAVTGLKVYPPQAVLEGDSATQQFIAVAKYDDGSTRDVTNLAVFLSNKASSAPVDENGLVSTGLRGEAFVMARFDTKTVGSQVLVLPAGTTHQPRDEQPANYIDELVGTKLETLRITPSGLCSDEEFLRRVTIDIAGALPTREEYDAFLASDDPQKRAAKIDELLDRKEFSEIWAMKWAELLMVKTIPNRVEYKPMFLYSQWITEQIAANVPLDEMVRNLLGSSGGSFSNPAVNFYQVEPTTQKTAENVAQVFLGIRVQCAQCHNHPFDRWTMDDYFSFTAFFSQIGRKAGEDYRETIVFNSGGGEVKHPVSGKVMKPKFLGGEEPDTKGHDRREVVADWITSPENPWFARSVANRVWAHFLGVGIVEPVDDFRVSNPPSNPELLETLGEKLVGYDYDFKQLVRDICNSNAYQRSSDTNASNKADTSSFSHAQIRRIQAEMLLDCICQVTGAPQKFRGLPLGARAVQIADGRTSDYFLKTFGRAERNTVCSCEVTTDPTLSQALHLLNGGTVHQKLRQGKLVQELLEQGKQPMEVVDELYVRSLSRTPTEEERSEIAELVGDEPLEPLRDVFWAVLNSREFLFNH